jgi:hypothetical protein
VSPVATLKFYWISINFSVKSLDLRAGGSVAALVILPTVLWVTQQFSVGVAGHAVPWALITELKTKIIS